MPATGPRIGADHRSEIGHLRTAHVGNPAGGRAERELHEPDRNLVRVDRLDEETGRDRDQRQLHHLLCPERRKS